MKFSIFHDKFHFLMPKIRCDICYKYVTNNSMQAKRNVFQSQQRFYKHCCCIQFKLAKALIAHSEPTVIPVLISVFYFLFQHVIQIFCWGGWCLVILQVSQNLYVGRRGLQWTHHMFFQPNILHCCHEQRVLWGSQITFIAYSFPLQLV